jgi:hypothetical protein
VHSRVPPPPYLGQGPPVGAAGRYPPAGRTKTPSTSSTAASPSRPGQYPPEYNERGESSSSFGPPPPPYSHHYPPPPIDGQYRDHPPPPHYGWSAYPPHAHGPPPPHPDHHARYWGAHGEPPRGVPQPPPPPSSMGPNKKASSAGTSTGPSTVQTAASSDQLYNEVDGREGATSPSQIELVHRDEVQHMGCTCKKTRCLKLYCQCFGVKLYCGRNCRCLTCYNSVKHEKDRKEAMRSILLRNPGAFDTKFKKAGQAAAAAAAAKSAAAAAQAGQEAPERALTHKVGCKCRKSACMKKVRIVRPFLRATQHHSHPPCPSSIVNATLETCDAVLVVAVWVAKIETVWFPLTNDHLIRV